MNQPLDCEYPVKKLRARLVLFGEPQLCRSCGRPVELNRSWQWGTLAAQVLALLLIVFSPLRQHGRAALAFAGLSALALLCSYWLFAPIDHQQEKSIRRRNRAAIVLAGIFLALSFVVLLWVL